MLSMPDERGALLPTLYATEESYGWSVGMRAVTHTLLDQVALPDGPLLELGCGGGSFLAEVADRRSVCAYGVEIHPLALAHARRRAPAKLLQADLHALPFANGSFGVIIALDTFDQQGVDLDAGLQESWRVLRPNGLLFLRVSAHAWLQGPHDAMFNTGRRYHKAMLSQELARARFHIHRMTYANALLALPVSSLRLLQRWRIIPLYESLYRSALVNRILTALLVREAVWLQQHCLPFGLSLYVIANKDP
jgi:SAM-dependent methyltransferase